MSTHFRWYPAESEVVVPFNARYSFPSQANKAMKMTPRIPPKNNATFKPGNVIRIEIPAQGYLNPGKTTLEFDVTMEYEPLDTEFSKLRFQNNIQSIFSRVRLLYGSTTIEDIPYYNVLIRSLTEWTHSGAMDQSSISEGIGNTAIGTGGVFWDNWNTNDYSPTGFRYILSDSATQFPVNVRQKYIHGIDFQVVSAQNWKSATPVAVAGTNQDHTSRTGHGLVPNSSTGGSYIAPGVGFTNTIHKNVYGKNPVRRYQVQLNLGLLQQEKLIPSKFMASQLAIEITLENPTNCMYYTPSAYLPRDAGSATGPTTLGIPSTVAPTYSVSNVNLIPEIMEFDASYDESFLRGLQSGGVPISFCTWNNYRFSQTGVSNMNMQINERSRSVKSIFAVLRREPASINTDSGATFFNTGGYLDSNGNATTLQDFQFRIGGRYFPAQPVQCSSDVGTKQPNSGCEAYVELAKALNTLGNPTISTALVPQKWAINIAAPTNDRTDLHDILPEHDYDFSLVAYKHTGSPVVQRMTQVNYSSVDTDGVGGYTGSCEAGDMGSCCFGMAVDLETSNGLEISGLNAEEQSDISLIVRYSATQAPAFTYDVFTYIDSMIVLRENNVMELIQ